MDDPQQSRTHLEQLADALSERGYDATVITPAPCLAVRVPGATIPQMIYNTGGRFWRHNAQEIALTRQVTIAADVITWALRTNLSQPSTYDATTSLATTPGQSPISPHVSGGGQEW